MKVLRIFNANCRTHRGWRKWILFSRSAPVRGRTPQESGVALVVTLILLSVITFMAIAFLVLSHREQSSTVGAYDQTIALQAANSGLERAQAVMLVNIITSGNLYNVGSTVSTNFINPYGFTGGLASPTNVNYDYYFGTANPLSPADRLRNIANLQYLARAPVFMTNRILGSNEFRFYLDENRNGHFDPSGWVDFLGRPVLAFTNGAPVTSVMGDPQWIGELEFADRPHSADNRFMFRYAYQIVPVSETMDVNYIHNSAASVGRINPNGFDYRRNQGVGTWEINLASLLYDVNTNLYAWGGVYVYDPLSPVIRGNGFADACSIVINRYGNIQSPFGLASVSSLFGPPGNQAFDRDYIDGYTSGPIMTNSFTLASDPDIPKVTLPWSGADNTNHLFTPQDFFDPTKTSVSFTNRLLSLGASSNAYDRYTFDRLTAVLGTESSPEPPGKMNLNYDNLVQTNLLGIASATNFYSWRPIDFFTNAANRMFADAGYMFGVNNGNRVTNNIQVWPTNFYTPSVHRLLQLAANIYDSTTNRLTLAGSQYPYCPSVFRPIFRRTPGGLVVIVGYREVMDHNAWITRGSAPIFYDPTVITANSPKFPSYGTPFDSTPESAEPMVSGVPLVIGAKKGFPSFNEFSMQTYIYVSRLLEFHRDPNQPAATSPIIETNQMYVMQITNVYGVEGWNSYLSAYPRNLQLIVTADMTEVLTNLDARPMMPVHSNQVTRASTINIPAGTWVGWTNLGMVQNSFVLPWGTNSGGLFLTNSTYIPRAPWFEAQTHIFDRGQGFYIPHWLLTESARLRFILYDQQAQRIVDYVNLKNTENPLDITAKLSEGAICSTSDRSTYNNPGSQWCTNRLRGAAPLRLDVPTYGILNQIGVGLWGTTDWNSFSRDPYAGRDAESAVDGFRYNLMGWGAIYPQDQGLTFQKSNVFYAPFDPYRPIFVHTSWQANDPLVHYTIGDLLDLSVDPTNQVDMASHNPPLDNLGQINNRFEPWGGNPTGRSNPDIAPNQMAAKDPLITRPDFWDFPTNKLANPGWLGRIHRGTPWQTIFLKSTNILLQTGNPIDGLNAWKKWTGNGTLSLNVGQLSTNLVPMSNLVQDAIFSLPTNDWRLMDLFTAAFNDNATRGRASVNQTNLASWSAVLAGVNVLTDARSNTFILPAGVYNPLNPPPLVRIVNGINATRTNFPHGSFQRLGDILATPELTIASPYISTNANAVISDAVVERIPQQVMGLLRGGEPPRFVIYSWGQTLKPAARGVLQSGTFVGMCTNYTITAEVATRTVVRVDGTPSNPRTVIESFNVLPPD